MKNALYYYFKPSLVGMVILYSLLGVCSVPAAFVTVRGVVRDFSQSHPDFETYTGSGELNIVENQVDAFGKPIYNTARVPASTMTTGEAEFNQWFNDIPGVNVRLPINFSLDSSITPNPNEYSYVNNAFFPIDGLGYGNEGRPHNYHFTFEFHAQFAYQGGETFSFTGDDDVWVFINDQLVIDLGGVHPPQTGAVSLDTLGLTVGNNYFLDFFFAERHTTGSSFRIDTTILATVIRDTRGVPEPSTVLYLCFAVSLIKIGQRLKLERHARKTGPA